ncbi:Alpha/Beta hydrolase protein [Kickxella alabastrina]|uniref:Alpha/Beta hydrolase protein n=1 Tax=Kickxella alabastrina TaxID=61397 RepID=UPI0022204171|nr:Alpha/Beta hydrolase protein [Kickxella alabastrina]KAI7828372.1 Alpha/Beta hydrolase protein [Kickxella alabastrina]
MRVSYAAVILLIINFVVALTGATSGASTSRLKEAESIRSVSNRSARIVNKVMEPGSEFKMFAHCLFPKTIETVVDYTWYNNLPASVGYISHNDRTGVIVVSFRGSADTQDWVQNSEFLMDPWPEHIPGSMVHHGFLTAYKSVSETVTARITRLIRLYPNYKLVFTGHSLGGAEAVLCAVDVLRMVPEVKSRVHIYTYGMPRIGNNAWADSIDALGIPIYRVVYESDLVPHIPFQWLGYQHFSQEVWIHKNQTHFCGMEQESLLCSAGTPYLDYNIKDHSQYSAADWKQP